MKKSLLIALTIIVILAGIWLIFLRDTGSDEPQQTATPTDQNAQQAESQKAAQVFDKSQYSIDEPTSIWVVVNKQRPLAGNYTPSDLRAVDVVKRSDKSAEELSMRSEAASALEKLFEAAERENISLLLGSGFRSYDLQKQYYDSYVASYGQEKADTFSARPGTSEHQTGLVADISGEDMVCYLEICFADQPEGKWLAQNAYRFGFIIRYQEGKEAITGYQYEPWHIRYVGIALASEIHKNQKTLEEFFEL